ncbi:hypothetical protein HGRIS_001520 [Hohenbuehelia grisea]|uniref:Uncharacterized protein n=1 Tax=Hohenbuehelia grisea TaxID=104357 RepID=A0ABR3JQJ2_9AGAR
MVSYTFRFKAFLSKLPVFSSIMSKSPPPPHPAALYLFPTTGVKEFTASEWFTLVENPSPNPQPLALHTYIRKVLFCKDRDGVEHEFLFIYYEYVHRSADETYGSTTGWLRIDRCIDKTKLVPAEERKHGPLASISPSTPDLSTPESIFPGESLGDHFARDTVQVYGCHDPPRHIIDADADSPVEVIGRHEFPHATVPLYMLAAAVYSMSRSVPIYDVRWSQCYWHAATIWKLLDEEYTSGTTTLSGEDRERIREINKMTFKRAGSFGLVSIPYKDHGNSLRTLVMTTRDNLKTALERIEKHQKTKEQLEAEREREATARKRAEAEQEREATARKRAEAERDRLEAALKEAEEKIASYNRTKGP